MEFDCADCILNRITFLSVLTIRRLREKLVQPPGIEPGSTVLQTAAMTTSAKVALVPAEGIEPSQERSSGAKRFIKPL